MKSTEDEAPAMDNEDVKENEKITEGSEPKGEFTAKSRLRQRLTRNSALYQFNVVEEVVKSFVTDKEIVLSILDDDDEAFDQRVKGLGRWAFFLLYDMM